MKILLVKTSSLGDIIQTFPVLDYLRGRFEEAQIDWVVENPYAELLRSHPQVDRVLTIESKKWRKRLFHRQTRQEISCFRKQLREVRYDLAFDLQGNLKSSGVLLHTKAKEKVGFGWRTVPEWPNLFFTSTKINPSKGKNVREDYLAIVQKYFKDENLFQFRPIKLKLNSLQEQTLASLFAHAPTPTLVCPFAAWPNKCLSQETLISFLKQLNRGPYWFAWGNAKERKSALTLSAHFTDGVVLERLGLSLLQHVMSRCQLVVAMDSLPLHLCGTTSTPSISFFGPSSATKYRPLGEQHRAIQGECPYQIRFEKRCPKLRTCKTGACLKSNSLKINL